MGASLAPRITIYSPPGSTEMTYGEGPRNKESWLHCLSSLWFYTIYLKGEKMDSLQHHYVFPVGLFLIWRQGLTW